MSLDMAKYIGAYMDAYTGSYSGLWYEDIADVHLNLETLTTLIPGLLAVPNLKAYTGTRQLVTPSNFSLSLVSSPYESSVVYPLDNFRADYLGVFENNVRDLARKGRFHFNNVAASVITTNATCADGVALFATTHPYVDPVSGALTQKNIVTSTDIPSLNVAVVAAPTDVEMSKIIVDLFAWMISLKDSVGDTVNGDMRSVTLLTGDIAKFSAIMKAIQANNYVLSDKSDNPVAGLAAAGVVFKCSYVPQLSGASIYMLRNDGFVKGIILGEVITELIALGPGTEYAKQNRQVLFGIDAVRGGVPGRFQSCLKATMDHH
jgi:hypothetical protein